MSLLQQTGYKRKVGRGVGVKISVEDKYDAKSLYINHMNLNSNICLKN
jgi:hypothetical protein